MEDSAKKIPRPESLKLPNNALKYTTIGFLTFGAFGTWLKWRHAQYLRCGMPSDQWQNYDEEFKKKEDKRWNINRDEIQPDYYKDVAIVQRVRKFWKSLTGAE